MSVGGKIENFWWIRGIAHPCKGKHWKLSEETKKKMSLSKIGKKPKNLSFIQKMPNKNFPTGSKHSNWKGGISLEGQKLRSSPIYTLWRINIIKRDDFTCLNCGKRGGLLEANHIYSFADYPQLRLDLNNGITLCKKCHNF